MREKKILGPEVVEKTVKVIKKIKGRIKTTQDKQKSYAEGVVHFSKRGKLRPRFIGPYEILE